MIKFGVLNNKFELIKKFDLMLGRPDNRESSEYCARTWTIDNSTYLNDQPCDKKFKYVCQPKTELFISKKHFQLQDVSVLGFSIGGCFSDIITVKRLLTHFIKCTRCNSSSYFRHRV